MNPKVSIVIPVYNGSNYLRTAVDSALAQTYSNIEVIVVNDGSTDGGATQAVALSYGDRIKYCHKPNGHVASALNFGIRHMSGEYFSWLSHDDMYLPDKVATQVGAAVNLGPRTVIYGDFETLDIATDDVRPVLLPDTPPGQFRWFLTVSNSLHGCTLLVPKTCFDECGLFDESLRTTQDYDLWFRIARRFRFVHVPGIGVRARLHPGQGTNQLRGVALQECDSLLAGFVGQLSDSELTAATSEPPSRAYATIAANMQSRGFANASETALVHAQKAARGEPFPSGLRSRLILLRRLRMGTRGRLLHRLRVSFGARSRSALRRLTVLVHPNGTEKRKFSLIFRKNQFGGSESRSGEGSSLAQTERIRREIPRLLAKLGASTLLDAPCGDFNWMQHVQLELNRYWGIDIVDEVIVANRARFISERREFYCCNLIDDPLPAADVVLCRDCLVHLDFRQAKLVLRNFKRSGCKYLLTTTFTNRTANADLVGDDVWRTLNLQLSPFNLPPPLELINEQCTEGGEAYSDKCLGLWRFEDLAL